MFPLWRHAPTMMSGWTPAQGAAGRINHALQTGSQLQGTKRGALARQMAEVTTGGADREIQPKIGESKGQPGIEDPRGI